MGSSQPPSYDQAQKQGERAAPDPYVSYPQVYGGAEQPPSGGVAQGVPAYQSSQWGTPVMGNPANPSSHPDNQHAAMSKPSDYSPATGHGGNGGYVTPPGSAPSNPYVQTTSVPSQGGGKTPMDSILESLNKWAKKAEDMAQNVWDHLKAGPSMTDTAWGKLSHGAKVLTEGGYENLFKQSFGAQPNERLRKSYACYLSTSTGPVPGVLYISTHKLAFCSDRPLSYTPAPGQQSMSYYKLSIPLEKLRTVNPSSNPQRPAEKYIQVVTVDNHEFWFMGFVNYDKGLKNLQLALSGPREHASVPHS